MSDQAQVWLVIAVGLGSAAISWLVTWHYWYDKHRVLLLEWAAEREAAQYEIRNARIVTDTFGSMRATSLANMEGDDHEG